MTRFNWLFAAVVAVGMLLAAAAHARWVYAGDVDVRFHAKGPAGLEIDGKAPKLDAEENDDGVLEITVPLKDLDTGMELRNKHLRKYLEVDKYPNATLKVKRSKLKTLEDRATAKGKAKGKFTLHGKTKNLKFRYKVKRTGSDYHVQGLAKIDIRDYDIEVPCYLGVCVDPKVKLKVKFKLRDK